ncbi:putative dna repair helicase protein [Phaeoacremonium minimum UCRPA7]|uniref:ATP-dependent DNA helicase CHL1 n=1 Tax=Phaeoacremonium minimum (strain UCR-PA7) TaxID=1286976 RepID=R8BUY3_PHAM7|nr:putative dna repair helicase protein [Phaeoacremonium minimum UCRPA7]EOO03167.1 putative dna repair helicase protein [Phaeoacremonium minimum UCRPA7]
MATNISGELSETSKDALKFHHPYTPYDVQLEFMKATYDVLQEGNGQVGILESPTGTGKSLSLICAAVTWLRNQKRGQFEESLQVDRDQFKNEPDWMIDQMLRRKRDDLVRRWEEREGRLTKIRMKEKSMEQRAAIKRRRLENPNMKGLDKDEEDEFLLDNWNSQDVDENGSLATFSKETQALLEKVGLGAPKSQDPDDSEPDDEIKFRDTALATLPDIEDMHQVGKTLQVCPYYASRTAIPGAEIITLPYPLLLQKSARDALGIKLEGNVVIIDEAHNIMDAVANVAIMVLSIPMLYWKRKALIKLICSN